MCAYEKNPYNSATKLEYLSHFQTFREDICRLKSGDSFVCKVKQIITSVVTPSRLFNELPISARNL